ILPAATVFVATNIDDIFILVGFLADPAYRIRDVILGQFLGVTAMTLLCLALSRTTMIVSPAAFGWLGLLDIGIGAKKLYDCRAVARERMIGEPRCRTRTHDRRAAPVRRRCSDNHPRDDRRFRRQRWRLCAFCRRERR